MKTLAENAIQLSNIHSLPFPGPTAGQLFPASLDVMCEAVTEI